MVFVLACTFVQFCWWDCLKLVSQ